MWCRGGSTLTMQVARLIEPRPERTLAAEAEADRARARDRARGRQGRRARSLPHPRSLRRQSRRRAGGVARLFRQGAAEAHDRRGGAHGRAAAVARGAAAGSLRQPPRAPPATACSTASPRAASSAPTTPAAAKREPVPEARLAFPALAAHAAEEAVAADPQAKIIRLSIDARLQAKLEALSRESVARLGPKLSAAMVVIDNATGEIRARDRRRRLMTTLRATARSTCRARRARRARR